MKIKYAILILFISIVIQTGFIRILDLFPFTFNLPLVLLFLLCYSASFEKILFFTIFTGIAIDLSSSVNFGLTSLSAFGAYVLSFYLREKVFKRGEFTDFLLNSLVTFIVFYCLLSAGVVLSKASINYAILFNLTSIILLDFIFCVLGYCLIEYLKNKRIYGISRNIKISY